MSETPLLGLPLLEAAQSQKHVTHNEALLSIDGAIHLSVVTRALAAPPASPADGARYLVAASASGDWVGHVGELAFREAGAWRFAAANKGWRLWVEDEELFLIYTGATWHDITAIASLQNMTLLGVNTSADTGNRLAVSSPAVLFTHAGNGAQLKVNKHAAADTASLLYQTNYSGRAEMGLAGDDDFHIKVSADGSSWLEAITINGATGAVTMPNTSPTIPDGSITTAKLGGDVTAAGKALLAAAGVAAQLKLLNFHGRALAASLIIP